MTVEAALIAGTAAPAFDVSTRSDFDVSVVVPTRNERDNVAPLLQRLEGVRPDLRVEVLFMDDSTDDTPPGDRSPGPSLASNRVTHSPAGGRTRGRTRGAVRAGSWPPGRISSA
jgi:hypothetical protein